MINGINFIKHDPSNCSNYLNAQLVECYRNVFSDEPWHEWLKCPKCQKYWGVKDQEFLADQKFIHCGVPLVDFWPREKVISDIFHEVTKEASCWLAIFGNSVIGFCWGYPITIAELEKKIEINFSDEFKEKIGKFKTVAYQDEVGVLPLYRGQKIAKAMVANRLNDFLNQGLKVGIVRTREYPEPSKTFLWYKKIGYITLASYPGNDGRVVLGRRLLDLPNIL